MQHDMSVEQYKAHIAEVTAMAVAELKKRFYGDCFDSITSLHTLERYASQLAAIPSDKHAEWWAGECIKEALSEATYLFYKECDANDDAYAKNNREPS